VADEARAPGFIASLQRIAATVILLAKSRLELATVEVEEQVAYAANLLIWSMVAITSAGVGLLFVGATLIIVCWDQHRLLAACLVTAVPLILALVAVMVVRSRLRQRPRFLGATITELGRDAGQS
jgi:uncharacterized membrane protein YqjE